MKTKSWARAGSVALVLSARRAPCTGRRRSLPVIIVVSSRFGTLPVVQPRSIEDRALVKVGHNYA